MDPRLQQAIEHDDVEELHRFIVEDPKLLDRACKGPFPDTPLHIAAAAGQTKVAIEMAIMKPSFARKLNPNGYSPMHLALEHGRYVTARALMKFNPKLIRVQGQRGITPLHYLAGKEGDDELELLAEFLVDCKSSIEDLTSRCETAVHVAVRNHNLKAFKILFGWLKRKSLTEILDWKDQDGNTVLHIAVSEEQPEIIKLLIGYTNVDVKNFQHKTALEIFQANSNGYQDVTRRLRLAKRLRKFSNPTLSQSQFFSRELFFSEKLSICLGISNECLTKTVMIGYFFLVAICSQDVWTALQGYWLHFSSNLPANSTDVTTNSSGTAFGKPHQAGNLIVHGLPLYVDMAINILFIFCCLIIAWSLCIIARLPYAGYVYLLLSPFMSAFYNHFRAEFPKPIEVAGASYWNFTSTSG